MQKVFITGAAGCLGHYLLRTVPEGYTVHALVRNSLVDWQPRHQLDLGDREKVFNLLESEKPDLVIHAAYHSKNLQNDILDASRNLVDACKQTGARLIHMSSDLVLDGEHAPYNEQAAPDPVLDYGHAKAEIEAYIAEQLPQTPIIRSALIVGLEPINPSSAWIVESLRDGLPISLFEDELRCPIAAEDLARMIWEIAALPAGESGGIWNLVGPEALSRYAIGLLLAQYHNLNSALIRPVLSNTSETRRPRDLRMTLQRAEAQLKHRARPLSEVLFSREKDPSGERAGPRI